MLKNIFGNKEEVPQNTATISLEIEGMTCDACQNHVNHAVNELSGIINVATSYAEGNAVVEFDNTQTTILEIETAVNSTGYKTIKTEKK